MQFAASAKAKIQAPRFRSGLIERCELEEHLGHAIASRRLVLLVAPAGYGKTAALSRQLHRLPDGCAVAWLNLSEEDDLRRFLAYLVEALEPLDPPWRVAPEALFELVAQDRLREAASVLLNTLEATDAPKGVIVLDDLHAVVDTRVIEFLGHLIEHLPQRWTLVVATRVEPPLSLGRWRVRGELAEFDATALSFSREEVEALWRSVTGRDDPEQARQLHDRTFGWAAGLCLGMETPERTASAPADARLSRRHLFDYLASQVFGHLPDELQQFLLRCSLLTELTVQRCEQISGNPRAATLLEDIERRRLFVSVLDADVLTLRLHDLFRDFLEEHLRRLRPEEMRGLLHVAARGETDPVRRTLMYLRAGAGDEAQQCLADAVADMLAAGEGALVSHTIEQFPESIRSRSPQLTYAGALCAWWQYRYDAVRSMMAHAATGFDAMGRHDEAQRARAMQALAMFLTGAAEDARRLSQAVRARPMDLETEIISELLDFWYEGRYGPVNGPGDHLAKIADLLTRGGSPELWARCILRINSFIARPGVPEQIQRLLQGALAVAGDRYGFLHANAKLTQAWMLVTQARYAELEMVIRNLEEDARWLGQSPSMHVRQLLLRGIYHVIRDDKAAVRATCDAIAEQVSSPGSPSRLSIEALAIVAQFSAAVDDLPAARRHLQAFSMGPRSESPATLMHVSAVEAQLALREGRTGEALASLRALASRSSELDMIFLDATVRMQLALAELAAGSPAAAWQALEPLVDRVMQNGLIGQILGAGVQSLARLAAASWQGVAVPQDRLDAMRQWINTARRARADQPEASGGSASRHAGLSAREYEVLALLADGQSNKLIARTLELSPHTVKRHVARILDRLDLASRAQAAAWYRAHFEGAPARAVPDPGEGGQP